MGQRLEIGSKWGRWVVLKRVSAARRGTERYTRARVLVRCVCGHEQTAFEADLTAGRTTGCRSAHCRARFEVSTALLDLARGKIQELETAIDGFLRKVDEDPDV